MPASGGECHGYSGDVSRTWPVNGVFSNAQRELYEALLHVQQGVLAALDTSRPSLDQLYRVMCSQLAAVLTELGIVPKEYTQDQKIKVSSQSNGRLFCLRLLNWGIQKYFRL